MVRSVGYDFLATAIDSGVFPITRPAQTGPVTRVTDRADVLLVPPAVAPEGDDPLAHLLFAFKHEGMNLQTAILSLKKTCRVGGSGLLKIAQQWRGVSTRIFGSWLAAWRADRSPYRILDKLIEIGFVKHLYPGLPHQNFTVLKDGRAHYTILSDRLDG